MAEENRFWGAEKIRGELLKLGIRVAKRTIQKYLRQARKGTSPGGQKWSTFLNNHTHEIWACDFVQTYDALFRQIFAFVIVQHDTREVVHHAVTYHPTQQWTAQQLRNATFDAAPRFLIRDNDGKYGTAFDDVARGSNIKVIARLHPNMNAICERFIGSLRRECLDHILLLGDTHMQRLVREYLDYFNQRRAHQGIGQAIPKGPANDNVPAIGEVISRPILGGLYHDYRRAA
jgi:putative transposase